MTIRLHKADPQTNIEFFQKKASEDFSFNDMVSLNSNGFLIPAADGQLITVLGLIQKTIASTDSDYASNTRVPVLVPGPDAEFLCDVGTGTAAQEDAGQWIDIDDELTVDIDASSYDIFFVVRVVSATQVICKMAKKSGAAAG